eukprot:GHVH01013862.1.p1 GENE.GHVH01013862.1~~GHVH01013862.1.p1  ORF type:complete len:417 (+),score=37.55 GHVH01013862.1:1446-2696(+)
MLHTMREKGGTNCFDMAHIEPLNLNLSPSRYLRMARCPLFSCRLSFGSIPNPYAGFTQVLTYSAISAAIVIILLLIYICKPYCDETVAPVISGTGSQYFKNKFLIPMPDNMDVVPWAYIKESDIDLFFVPSTSVKADKGPMKGKDLHIPVRVFTPNVKTDWTGKKPEMQPFVLLNFMGSGDYLLNHSHLEDISKEKDLNCMVVTVEYPGVGFSTEHLSKRSPEYMDYWADDVYRWLTKDLRISPHLIIPYGYSLGGAVAARLGKVMKTKYGVHPTGVILHSTFRSIDSITKRYVGNLAPLLGNHWSPEDDIMSYNGNLTTLGVLHGVQDNNIPISHAETLLRAHKGKTFKKFIGDSGHFMTRADILDFIIGFFARLTTEEVLNIEDVGDYLMKMKIPEEYKKGYERIKSSIKSRSE